SASHSAAICRSRSARRMARSFRRARSCTVASCALHQRVEETAAVTLGRHAVEEPYRLFGQRDVDASLHGIAPLGSGSYTRGCVSPTATRTSPTPTGPPSTLLTGE